jgi:hypothetical protein
MANHDFGDRARHRFETLDVGDAVVEGLRPGQWHLAGQHGQGARDALVVEDRPEDRAQRQHHLFSRKAPHALFGEPPPGGIAGVSRVERCRCGGPLSACHRGPGLRACRRLSAFARGLQTAGVGADRARAGCEPTSKLDATRGPPADRTRRTGRGPRRSGPAGQVVRSGERIQSYMRERPRRFPQAGPGSASRRGHAWCGPRQQRPSKRLHAGQGVASIGDSRRS